MGNALSSSDSDSARNNNASSKKSKLSESMSSSSFLVCLTPQISRDDDDEDLDVNLSVSVQKTNSASGRSSSVRIDNIQALDYQSVNCHNDTPDSGTRSSTKDSTTIYEDKLLSDYAGQPPVTVYASSNNVNQDVLRLPEVSSELKISDSVEELTTEFQNQTKTLTGASTVYKSQSLSNTNSNSDSDSESRLLSSTTSPSSSNLTKILSEFYTIKVSDLLKHTSNTMTSVTDIRLWHLFQILRLMAIVSLGNLRNREYDTLFSFLFSILLVLEGVFIGISLLQPTIATTTMSMGSKSDSELEVKPQVPKIDLGPKISTYDSVPNSYLRLFEQSTTDSVAIESLSKSTTASSSSSTESIESDQHDDEFEILSEKGKIGYAARNVKVDDIKDDKIRVWRETELWIIVQGYPWGLRYIMNFMEDGSLDLSNPLTPLWFSAKLDMKTEPSIPYTLISNSDSKSDNEKSDSVANYATANRLFDLSISEAATEKVSYSFELCDDGCTYEVRLNPIKNEKVVFLLPIRDARNGPVFTKEEYENGISTIQNNGSSDSSSSSLSSNLNQIQNDDSPVSEPETSPSCQTTLSASSKSKTRRRINPFVLYLEDSGEAFPDRKISHCWVKMDYYFGVPNPLSCRPSMKEGSDTIWMKC